MENDDITTTSITWEYAEKNLANLESVTGGFSNVKKGLLTLSNGSQIFVKLGLDEATDMWTHREIDMYRFLNGHGYSFMPKLLAVNDSLNGFVLEALTLDKDWYWEDVWTNERLNATFAAMAELTKLELSQEEKQFLSVKTLSEGDNGWKDLAESTELQGILIQKLHSVNKEDLGSQIDFEKLNDESSKFKFSNDTLVHNDVRADNCAWNPKLNQVRLIDWNWAQLGDTRIDTGALLVNVHKSGFDIRDRMSSLDKDALVWLAGFWLASACKSVSRTELGELRDSQLNSGIAALELVNSMK